MIKSLEIYITIIESTTSESETIKTITACRFGDEVKKRRLTSPKEKSPRG